MPPPAAIPAVTSNESPGRNTPMSSPVSAKTIILARFVPIVRTFAPVLAGVGEMDRRTFTTYNVVGGFVWGVGVTLAGYLLSEVIGDSIDRYLLPIIAVIIVLSILPPLIEALRQRRQSRAVTPTPQTNPPTTL